MITDNDLLSWLQQSIDTLLAQGQFVNGDEFRPTQRNALNAYKEYLARNDLSLQEKLVGFFTIPTGVGKTAIFLGILNELYQHAAAANEELRTIIVAPRNTLLTQLEKKAIKKYAPFLVDKTGIYGAGKKQLDKPLTVMTYNAWMDLSEAGVIGSHNTRVIISDEGHRGLSKNRIARIFDTFYDAMLRISFSATSRFDADKSIEDTHHREIYGRDVRPAIEDGELAAYARCQFYSIRVNPIENEEEELKKNPNLISELRKKAWTKRCVAILRDGVDPETNEPLSDFISGFYVDGITHANDTEHELNNDPVLAAKAKKLGYSGVAVAIHSDMSGSSQRRRMAAFEAGHYMAIVGDEMLKEGHDYAPLKNIFDWQRNSIVDKAQIIGRALRQYYDNIRQRFLGANIIDAVIYVGHNDPDTDKKRKESALRYSVQAWAVLDGTVVYGPSAEPTNREAISSTPRIPIDGQEVESAITLEEVNAIKKVIDNLAPGVGFVGLDEPLEDGTTRRQRLIAERDRTDLGAVAMFARLQKKADQIIGLEGLSKDMIRSWFADALSAYEPYYNLVMDQYRLEEDKKLTTFVDLYEKLEDGTTRRERLIAEKDRTGLDSAAILRLVQAHAKKKGINPEELSDLQSHNIRGWYNKGKSARTNHFDLVMEAYRLVDTKDCNVVVQLDEERKDKPTLREHLLAEKKRTELGAVAIFENLQKHAIANGIDLGDLTAKNIESWYNPRYKTAEKKHFDLVIEEYARVKGDTPVVYVKLDENDKNGKTRRDNFLAERERTGVGASGICKRVEAKAANQNIPLSGKFLKTVNTWSNPLYKSANEVLFDLVMQEYAELPDGEPQLASRPSTSPAQKPNKKSKGSAPSQR